MRFFACGLLAIFKPFKTRIQIPNTCKFQGGYNGDRPEGQPLSTFFAVFHKKTGFQGPLNDIFLAIGP